ncbi:MAG: (Fe-S)-binding protein [Caldilineae bacterium]|nr:MAG: (Fe-S)-binding protein [Caldilineae bacterium]
MLTPLEKLLFTALLFATAWNGYWAFRKVYLVIRRGQGEVGDDHIVRRAWNAFWTWALLRPTWKTRTFTSLFHAAVAWGFIFYFLVNFGDILEGYFDITFLGQGLLGDIYRFIADWLSIGVLVGMIYFLVRRFIAEDPALSFRENIRLLEKVQKGGLQRDSLIVGFFILFHVGFRFLGTSFQVALHGAGYDISRPWASTVGKLWQGLSPQTLTVFEHLSWWIALGLILAFIPYFPYSKHFHLIMAGVNFLVKPNRTSLGTLEPIDFEDESIEQFGVARLEDLSWKHLLDPYACIMCNRCQDVCPAYATGKELSPSALEINKRYYINAHVDTLAAGEPSQDRLLDFAITRSAVWACTACGACIEVCPVGNEPMFDILYMRRDQVLMESNFPEELQTAYTGMERNGNPWKMSAADRMAWAAGLDIPTVESNPNPDILWWVGCAPAYDMRAQATAKAFARVLQAAGVNFAVLGERESCTGDAARRSGNEYLFYELAMQNIEVLNEVNPPRIVTTCPHCLHTLGKEYGQFGGHYQVIHHTELLAELLAEGRVSPGPTQGDGVAFHDPCYLGRHNGVYEAPRQVLRQAVGDFLELARNRNFSFCCGAGGGQMWKEEEHGQAAVNMTRYREAVDAGARTIAVGCPFCLTMLTDASKEADEGVQVKDVVELLAENLT